MREKLRALITQLRLHGMAEALDAELARAEQEAVTAPELLDGERRSRWRGNEAVPTVTDSST